MRLVNRPAVAAIAGMTALLAVFGVLGPAAGAAPAALLGPMAALTASAAPALPTGTARLGRVPADTRLQLDVTLKVQDQAALAALLNGLADKSSPYFHQFVTPAQFGVRFGPTQTEVALVRSALAARGLSPGPVTANRLTIPVTATAGQAERAFGIAINRYRTPGGRIAYANATAPKLPLSIEPLVTGVIGLDEVYPATDSATTTHASGAPEPTMARQPGVPATAGPQPCAAARTVATAKGSFTTNQLALHYGLSPLYQLGDLGQGVRVAVLEEQTYKASDIAAYESCYGIRTAVHVVTVATPVTKAGTAATMAIEELASLAPKAAIDLYESGSTADPEFEMISRAVDSDADKVVLDTFYTCEIANTGSLPQSEETLAEEADAQGQTMLMDAGITGSTGCAYFDSADKAKLSVETLAAMPYVIGVGGTTLSGDAPLSPETVFNESGAGTPGAGGGGLSVSWCMPDYQHKTTIPGLISKYSKKKTSCQGGAVPYAREVPDISAEEDWYTGYVIYDNGAWAGGWGGATGAEAVIAAVAAIIDASPFCSDYGAGDAGLLPQALYKFVSEEPFYIYRPSQDQEPEALGDIVSGNNDYTPSGYKGGLYPATTGYDLATGLGYPLVSGLAGKNSGPIGHPAASNYFPGLAAGMCYTMGRRTGLPKVTKVTPAAGKAGQAVTVTVHGENFLPVTGADRAKVTVSLTKTYILAASCKSSTVCTVRLPALSARTIDVQISAADGSYSGDVKADHFSYAPVPRIASVSPGKGKRGTKVVIRGTGFVAVKGVYFGGRKGVAAKVVSGTEITVFAPSGSGTVKVTVVTAGGTAKGKFAY